MQQQEKMKLFTVQPLEKQREILLKMIEPVIDTAPIYKKLAFKIQFTESSSILLKIMETITKINA